MNVHDYALTFGIDGVLIPVKAAVKVTQRYETLGGRTLTRMSNGRGHLQSRWQKIRSELSGTGWAPLPLAALDRSIVHTIDCVAPRAVPIGTPVIERPDVPGVIRDGMYVYWPRLTGYLELTEDTDPRSATWGWTITIEEE